MRLIDADKLMDSLRGNVLVDVTPWLEEAIDEQPTVYEQPVRRGEWIEVDEDYIMCSNCKEKKNHIRAG